MIQGHIEFKHFGQLACKIYFETIATKKQLQWRERDIALLTRRF